MDTVLFDLGAVLIDWNPRYLYRPLFKGDEQAMEYFLAEIAPPWWNLEIDAGKQCCATKSRKAWRFCAICATGATDCMRSPTGPRKRFRSHAGALNSCSG